MRPRDPHIVPLVAAMIVAIAPQVTRIPLWISLWCAGLWGYVIVGQAKGSPPMGQTLRQLLTLAGFVGGMVTYDFSFNTDAGVGLLAIMVGLKPLEIRSHRDRMMTAFLTYFLVITNLLYTNALVMTLYMAISVLITTAVLAHINNPGRRFGFQLRRAGVIMVQAVPWMVILFVVFPRIHGNLWGSPTETAGKTGFSDRLDPGSVSTIVQSSEIAFRVEFDGEAPSRQRLYWRGVVFNHFNGEQWLQGSRPPGRTRPVSGTDPIDYTVTLEPHGQRWLFALDLPYSGQRPAFMLADHTLMSWRRVHGRIRYRVRSTTDYQTGPLQSWERTTLTLPPFGNERARQLAREWRQSNKTTENIVQQALDYLKTRGFVYTLNAPRSRPPDLIDHFLFESKKGYCEHYASAFAFLMRAAGVPARIVGGYLGGEVNPYGDYLIIRQSDAHAWVEIWMPDRGWHRVDPTSAVAPARVEGGAAAALDPEERRVLAGFGETGPLGAYWKKVQLGLDTANNQWNSWVLGYSRLEQRALFRKLGFSTRSMKGPVIATLMVVFMGPLAALFWIRRSRVRRVAGRTRIQQAYDRFCLRLAGIGLPREPHLGPVDYCSRILAARPDLADAVRPIVDGYVRIRYAGRGDDATVAGYLAAVRRFHPKKNPSAPVTDRRPGSP